MKKRILVFGNPLLPKDAISLNIMPKLEKEFSEFEFIEFMPEDGLEDEGRNLLIIDTVEGLNKCKTIENFNQIKTSKLYSLHDFGLGENLLLLKKLEKIDSFKVFGIPLGYNDTKAFEEIKKLIKSNLL